MGDPTDRSEQAPLVDLIAEVLADHFDPEPVTGQEFATAARAVLDALALEQVGWCDDYSQLYGFSWVTAEMGTGHVYAPVFVLAGPRGRPSDG